MHSDNQDRQRRHQNRRDNMCPTHEVKLKTKHYGERDLNEAGENLDLLIIQCPIDGCTDGHGMVENFAAKKEKKRQNWIKKNAPKIVSDELDEIEQEELQTQQ